MIYLSDTAPAKYLIVTGYTWIKAGDFDNRLARAAPARPAGEAQRCGQEDRVASVNVFELTYPGMSIALDDRDAAFQITTQLNTIELYFAQAAMEVHLFEQAQAQVDAAHFKTFAEMPEMGAIAPREAVEPTSEPFGGMDPQAYFDTLEKTRRAATRQKWESGEPPRLYLQRVPFIYARSFLFSVDNIRKLLRAIADLPATSKETRDAVEALDSDFPLLKELRDSAAHLEERIAGRWRGRKIRTKPTQGPFVHAPHGGVLIVEILFNERFAGTTADGELAEVSINTESVRRIQTCVQRVIDSLPWEGPERVHPE